MKKLSFLCVFMSIVCLLFGQTPKPTSKPPKGSDPILYGNVGKFVTAASKIQTGTYFIISQIENKKISVGNNTNANFSNLVIWDHTGGENQQFIIEPSNETGYYFIKTIWGRSLDIEGASTASGATLYTYDHHGGDNQKWKFIDVGNGYYNIQSKLGTYLDVKNANSANGALISMSAYSTWGNNIAQRWKLEVKSSSSSILIKPNWGQLFDKVTSVDKGGVRTKLDKDRPNTNNDKPTIRRTTDPTERNGWVCWNEKIDWTTSPIENVVSGKQDNTIYPGALYIGTEFIKGSFAPYNHPNGRPPMTISASFLSGNLASTQERINSPNLANIRDGINRILYRNGSVGARRRVASQMSKSIVEITSEEALQMHVGVNYSGYGADVQGTFNYRNKTRKHVYVGKFYQLYFTVAVNDDLSTMNTVSDDAIYISQVGYGRIGFVRFESDLSEEQVRATLDARYSGFGNDVALDLAVNWNKFRNETQITGFAYGGSASAGASAFNNLESFDNWIRSEAEWDPGVSVVPINYQFKFLKDSRVGYITSVASYTQEKCEKVNYVKLKLRSIFREGCGENEPIAGSVKCTIHEMQDGSRNIFNREIMPEGYDNSLMWKVNSHSLVAGGYNESASPNVNSEWRSFKLDPLKLSRNEYILNLDFNLGVEHRDGGSFLSTQAGHWLAPGNTLVNKKFELKREVMILQGDRFKYFTIGPFNTPTDRAYHRFLLQFEVMNE
jgi:hypothetical protein